VRTIEGCRVAFLVAMEGFEQVELTRPWADWVDREVVVDDAGPGPLITSRKPDDLEAFDREVVAVLADAMADA
jgi:putative intracellular protease/amidase